MFSGLDTPETKAWGDANDLVPVPWFSHNLASIFTIREYMTHPEFFPLVGGIRLIPRAERASWNPDLARPDVAAFAAQKAIEYFNANPSSESFALGTNDGVMFGESPELLAMVAAAPPRSLPSSAGVSSARDSVASVTQPSGLLSHADAGHGATGEARGTVFADGEHRGTAGTTLSSRWFRRRPDYSNLVFTFMNRVAEQVAPVHPDKYLGALAYYWAENAPDFPVHPNVMPFLTADRSQGYDPAFRAEEAALQARWAEALGLPPTAPGAVAIGKSITAVSRFAGMKSDASHQSVAMPQSGPPSPTSAGHRVPQARDSAFADSEYRSRDRGNLAEPRLGLYDYVYGYGFLIPRQHTAMIADYLPRARALGFTDYYAEVGPNWGLDGPQPWLLAQLARDPGADARALLDEYYARYFREAAGPMRQFFEESERIWREQPGSSYWLKHYRNESQAALFPPAVCADLRRHLDRAVRAARSPIVAERVALVSAAFGVTERLAKLVTTRNELIAWALAPRARAAAGRRGLDAFLAARADFIAYTTELRRASPLAVHAFNGFDYLENDPTWLAVDRLVALGAAPSAIALAEPEVAAALSVLGDAPRAPRELLPDGGLEGPKVAARRIAGLPYGVDAPEGWLSAADPWKPLRFALNRAAARTGGQGVRFENAIGASLFRAQEITPGSAHVASVWVRGRFAAGGYATVTLSWTDQRNRIIGARRCVRLPEGDWPEWVQIKIGGVAPAGASRVVIGFTGQYLIDGGWVEFDDASVGER